MLRTESVRLAGHQWFDQPGSGQISQISLDLAPWRALIFSVEAELPASGIS